MAAFAEVNDSPSAASTASAEALNALCVTSSRKAQAARCLAVEVTDGRNLDRYLKMCLIAL